MDNATPIEAISIEFTSDNSKALKSIVEVAEALQLLTEIGSINPNFSKRLNEINTALKQVDTSAIDKLTKLGDALQNISSAKVPTSVFSNLSKISAKAKIDDVTDSATKGMKFDVTPNIDPSVAAEFKKEVQETSTAEETATQSTATLSNSLDGLLDKITGSAGATGTLRTGISGITEELVRMSAAIRSAEVLKNKLQGAAQPSPVAGLLPALTDSTINQRNAPWLNGTWDNPPQGRVLDNINMQDAVEKFKQLEAPIKAAKDALLDLDIEGKKVGIDLSAVGSKIGSGLKTFANEAKEAFSYVGHAIAEFATKKRSLDSIVSGKSAPSSQVLSAIGGGIGKIAKIPLGIWAKQFTSLGSAVTNATARIGKFFGSIKRVATYRLIRFALKMITNGFKEGTANLYEWSKKFDSAQEFAKSMDKIATAALYVKNSLGAMVAPIINALAPALDWLAEKFVSLLNVVNEFFAAITGAETYTVARKVATEFKDVSDGANKATKAIKSYTIGIDELNIIEESKGSGSGSGGGSDVAENWFKKETVSKKMKDFVDTIKKMFESGDWEGIGKLIGTKINEWIDKVPWAKIGRKAGKIFTAAFTIGTAILDTIDFEKFGRNVATTINNFFKEADFSKAGEFFVTSFFSGVDFIGGFLDGLDWKEVTGKISDFFIGGLKKAKKWFEKKDWKEVGKRLYENIKDALNGLKLADLIGEAWDLLKGITHATIDVVVSFIGSWGTDIGNWFYDLTQGKLPDAGTQPLQFIIGGIGADIIEGLVYLAKNGYIDEDLNITVKSVDQGLYNIGEKTTPLAPGAAQFLPTTDDKDKIDWRGTVFSLPSDYIKSYKQAYEWLKDIKGLDLVGMREDFKDLGEGISKAFEFLGVDDWDFTKNFGALGAVIDVAKDNIKKFKKTVEEIAEKVATAFGSIPKAFEQNWTKISGKLRYIKAKVELEALKLWNAVKSGFKTKLNQFIDVLNSGIKGIFKGLNKVGKAIDKLTSNGSLGMLGGGEASKIGDLFATAPQIPKLARGGVIRPNDPFLAMLGDQKKGTNIEAPLSTIKQAVGEEIRKQYDATQISMPDISSLAGEIANNIDQNEKTLKNDTESIKKFLENSIIPLLSDIATDTKRQADKNEKTEVVMDSRRVAESVNRQNRANGYSFIR